tara:strand:- start:10994 stop:11191 length:198 start_codon:yes stop_codon:yes gene_type:complete
MSDKKYITVLDFTWGEVFQYKIPKVFTGSIPWQYEDYEDFLREKGHSLSSCEWMEHKKSRIIRNN